VIRQGDRRHVVGDCGSNQVIDAAGCIKEAVVRMIVKMDELGHVKVIPKKIAPAKLDRRQPKFKRPEEILLNNFCSDPGGQRART